MDTHTSHHVEVDSKGSNAQVKERNEGTCRGIISPAARVQLGDIIMQKFMLDNKNHDAIFPT